MRYAGILLIFLSLMTEGFSEERVFTNKDGKKITAEVETVREGKVFLKMNGNRFAIPFLSLSMSDQEYLREWVKSNFEFRFRFRVKEEEDPSSAPAERTKFSKTENSAWRYAVEIENRSGIVADGLRAEYRIYKRMTERSKETKQMTEGAVDLGSIEHTRKALFSTTWIATYEKRWTVNSTYTRQEGLSTVTVETSDTYKASSKLDGIWIRIYRGDKLIGEYKSEGKMIKDATW